jgi:hypothetical protein
MIPEHRGAVQKKSAMHPRVEPPPPEIQAGLEARKIIRF